MIFGGLGNLSEMMKQAQQMQHSLKKIKEELKNARYDSEVGGVKVVVDGEMVVQDIKISGDQDIRKIEDNIKQAVNKALKRSKDDAADRLKSVTGGLSIPGLT